MTAVDKQRLSKLLLELHAFLEAQKECSENCLVLLVFVVLHLQLMTFSQL